MRAAKVGLRLILKSNGATNNCERSVRFSSEQSANIGRLFNGDYDKFVAVRSGLVDSINRLVESKEYETKEGGAKFRELNEAGQVAEHQYFQECEDRNKELATILDKNQIEDLRSLAVSVAVEQFGGNSNLILNAVKQKGVEWLNMRRN